MPLFRLTAEKLVQINQIITLKEKELENFLEINLKDFFGVRCVIPDHHIKVGLLALDQDGSPLIIEYKKVISESTISEGIAHLNWLIDNKENFNLAVQKILGDQIEIIWIYPRLVFITESFLDANIFAHYSENETIEFWILNSYADNLFSLYPICITNIKQKTKIKDVETYKRNKKETDILPYFFEGNKKSEK